MAALPSPVCPSIRPVAVFFGVSSPLLPQPAHVGEPCEQAGQTGAQPLPGGLAGPPDPSRSSSEVTTLCPRLAVHLPSARHFLWRVPCFLFPPRLFPVPEAERLPRLLYPVSFLQGRLAF